jgi:aspartate racemase
MKTIGLIGGMSWESTAVYYRVINQTVNERLGGLHSARIVLVSVDLAEIEARQEVEDWDGVGRLLADAARRVEAAGADFLVLCTNTAHRVASAIEAAAAIPLLHIADPTAEAVKAAGVTTVGLLGTRFTTEQDFYRCRLTDGHGLEVLVPDEAERDAVHRMIFEELCRREAWDASKRRFREIMARLVDRGAGGIILGCTELGLLLDSEDAPVPLFDTASLHARAAAMRAENQGIRP